MSISTNDFLRFKGGVEQNDFTKILNLCSDENTVRVKTLYHNVDDLKNFLAKNSKKITVLSLNIDSLNSKFDELNILIHTLAESNVFISVICIQEARIGENSNVGTAIVHYYFFSLAGPHDKQFVFAIRAKLGLTPKWMLARTPKQVGGAQMVDKLT